MQNYQQNSVTGEMTTWKRSYKIQIDSKYGEIPRIIFFEEIIKNLPDNTFATSDSGALVKMLEDPLETFPLLNPQDGSSSGTATLAQLQVMFYSVYLYLAQKRDEEEAVK